MQAVKVLTTLGLAVYLYTKIADGTFNINYTPARPLFLLLAFLLTPLNWLVESYKWKLLAAQVQVISIGTAVKATLSGLASSVVTPFRLGDPLGKVLFLKEENRVQGAMLSIIGGLCQLAVTFIAGIMAVLALTGGEIGQALATYYTWGIGVAIVAVVVGYVLIKIIKKKYGDKLKAALSLGWPLLSNLFTLSVTRYILFLLQFIFVFAAYAEPKGAQEVAMLTAVYFFVVSVVPMFIVAEAGMRGAIAIAVFTAFTHAFTAATMVWMINLLLPALIGMVFIWLQKGKNRTANAINPTQPTL